MIKKLADRFFRWFCRPEYYTDIRGDLEEMYQEYLENNSRKKADWAYAMEVLLLLRLSLIRPFKFVYPKFYPAMFNHNLKIALRSLLKQRLNTFLNLTGMTIGILVCVLTALFIHYELSFDRYHKKADRIYRVNQVWEMSGEKEIGYGAPAPLPEAIRKEIPSAEKVAFVYPQREGIIELDADQRFKQSGVIMAEAEILDIFDFEILEGNAHEALRKPEQAILTESTAEKFFGTENPIGKTFMFKNMYELTVAAIMKDLPVNTHLPATMLVSYFPKNKFLIYNQDNWGLTFGASAFVLLKEGVDPQSLHAPIRKMYDLNYNDIEEDPEFAYAELQALSQIHMDPEVSGGGRLVKAINPMWFWFFGGIALLVLALACINFVNLSTAQALTRAKEVGVRKAIGAEKKQLIGIFLGEALLITVTASIAGIVLALLFLPYINELLDKEIGTQILMTPLAWGSVIGFVLMISVLTGIYPAMLIARFKAATAMKSTKSNIDIRSNFLRKGLIVTQFAISGALLIALIIMSQQMNYFHQKNLGFDKENIITVALPEVEKGEVFKDELAKLSKIEQISMSLAAPIGDNTWTTRMHEEDLNSIDAKDIRIIWADENYYDFYKLQLLSGRLTTHVDTSSASEGLESEKRLAKAVVNERLLEEMGYGTPEQALGKDFLIGINGLTVEVVGVIKDFNISSLHNAIKPLMISPMAQHHEVANIKLSAGEDLPETLAGIRTAWEALFPKHIYDFHFLDQTIDRYYAEESRLYSLFRIFAALALLISCLGLWGLATLAAVQRTKEIGIRKVLGASTSGLVALMSKEFLILVAISLLIAVPAAWYGMSRWLENFAFHIDIKWSIFIWTGLLVLGIAFLTVSYQSIRTALSNPVSSLRSE